ncbi:MAG: endonuclease domain-containing protein [Rhizobiales bacterium]|nr:endonuclease domain-containing protein [Hyphomicrobiales bacterium]
MRRDQIDNLSFRRQHPVGAFTLDFYCPSLRLAIEVDGGQHAEGIGKRRDEQRTTWLESKGIVIIRFWNNDVLTNLNGVLEVIAQVASQRRALTPSPTLPLSGGGRTKAVP